jgi:hypothetical protein
MDRPEDRGVYRRIPVRIMGAFHEPPDPVTVPELMENLAAEFDNKKLHPISQNFSYCSSLLSIDFFSTELGCKNYVIFAVPFTSVYEELHADRETGC